MTTADDPLLTAALAFVREIPIFSGLDAVRLEVLIQALGYRVYHPGQAIITAGEVGNEFFVMADGAARVTTGGRGDPERVVAILGPGDSFGEVALIEKVSRTASVKATARSRTLVLSRAAFDRIFPQGSAERAQLTTAIRTTKLVLESPALSHLTPKEVRTFIGMAQLVNFGAGDWLMREGEVGDSVFLIASGTAQVVRGSGEREVAQLARGDLVGAIAVVTDLRRTASVRAVSELVALRVDRASFRSLCLSNMFVALLVSEMTDRQLAASRVG